MGKDAIAAKTAVDVSQAKPPAEGAKSPRAQSTKPRTNRSRPPQAARNELGR